MALTRRQFIGLLASASAASCARVKRIDWDLGLGSDDTFTFATVNDTHVLDAGSTAIVNRAVSSINGNKDIRFAVVLGDLATQGRLPELSLAKSSLDKLEKPYFVVPGNHDVDPTNQNMFASYEHCFGKCTWTEDSNGWAFIGLDSCEGTASDVSVRPERLAWLDKQISRIKAGRPIALFLHHPFNPHTKAYRVKNADDVLARFDGHNLKLVAAGHYHGNQVEERDRILFTTTACCSSTRGNFDKTPAKGYRLFHVAPGKLDTEFVEVGSQRGLI